MLIWELPFLVIWESQWLGHSSRLNAHCSACQRRLVAGIPGRVCCALWRLGLEELVRLFLTLGNARERG